MMQAGRNLGSPENYRQGLPLNLLPRLCNLFFRFYRAGLIRVRAEVLFMRMRMGGVHWRKVRFLLGMMLRVRVKMVIRMVLVLVFFAFLIRALFCAGMVLAGISVRVMTW